MSEMTVTCWNCGAQSQDPEWCDVCGAELKTRSADQPWLEVGDAVGYTHKGTLRMARIVELTEMYSTRRVGLARVCPSDLVARAFTPAELERWGAPIPAPADPPQDDASDADDASAAAKGPLAAPDDAWELVLFEESINDNALQPHALPEHIRALVYLPFATLERGEERLVEIFDAEAGAPLHEYLDSLGRLLTLEEAAGVTFLLMDAVETIHKSALYHFQLCPWTIRITHRRPANDAQQDDPTEELQLTFEGIRGFYDAKARVDSHPVIMGFSPPEFFGRAQGPLDQRADIFAIGMVFYYLLAGAPPPSGSLTRNTPCLPVRAFRFEIPPGLQPFIDGCTNAEPEKRFESIAAARKALIGALDIAHRRAITRPSQAQPDPARRTVSLYCAVDRHIGIGKGRRSPINQDAVFIGHEPSKSLALITVSDGVSTASYGSGDIASRLLVTAAAEAWREREALYSLVQHPDDDYITRPVSPPPPSDRPPISGLAAPVDELPEPAPALIVEIPDAASIDEEEPALDAAPDAADAAPTANADAEADADDDAAQAASDDAAQAASDDADADADAAQAASDDAAPVEAAAEAAPDADAVEGADAAPDDADASPQADPSTPPEPEPEPEPEPVRPPANHDVLKGRIGLTGTRSAPPVVQTPAASFLQDLLARANSRVSKYINARYTPFDGPVHEVMGTTALLALIAGNQITLSSLGDSRIYLLRDGHMECLTRDHNLATLRMIEGFPADESLLLPHGKALARCLGTFHVDETGVLQPIAPEPDVFSFRIMPGDTILLTTDGLVDFGGPTEAAAERNIQTILEEEEIPALACLRLILLANEHGGEDNIGLAVIRVTELNQSPDRVPLVQVFPPPYPRDVALDLEDDPR